MSTPVLSSEPEATPPSANLSGVLALMEDLVSEVAEESRAKTTRYQQGQQWKSFSEWCDARGLQSLPADPETVAVSSSHRALAARNPTPSEATLPASPPSTDRKDTTAPAPTGWPWSSRVSSTGPRKRASAKNAPNPSPVKTWRRSGNRLQPAKDRPGDGAFLQCPPPRPGGHCPHLGDAGRPAAPLRSRRNPPEHIAPQPDGSGRLTIPWSKTDQEGEGVVLYLGPPTMKAVDRIRPRQQLLPEEKRTRAKSRCST